MRHPTLRFLVALAAAALSFGVAPAALAATVWLEPESTTVGVGEPFLVDVKVSSDEPADAISISVSVPAPLAVPDAADGGSIVNFWVERPHVVPGGAIALSGIVPGGFQGEGGRVATLQVVAPREGTFYLAASPGSLLYRDGAPLPTVVAPPLAVVAVAGRGSSAARVPDRDAPEPFSPVLVRVGTPARWAVAFETQDKGLGVAGYEVAESPHDVELDDEAALGGLPWRAAESPETLADQALDSTVYVRARDRAGLAVVEKISPPGAGGRWRWWLSGATLLAALAAFIYARRHERSPRR